MMPFVGPAQRFLHASSTFRTLHVRDALVTISEFATTAEAVQSLSVALRQFGRYLGEGGQLSLAAQKALDAMSARLQQRHVQIAHSSVEPERTIEKKIHAHLGQMRRANLKK